MLKLPQPVVIFVRPQAPGNIGALSRAMSNFSLEELRLCGEDPSLKRNPDDDFSRMDWALAKRGEDILSHAAWFADLKSAVGDLHLVIGSSGREMEFERGYARPHLPPHEAFLPVLTGAGAARASGNAFRWGLVLGPEDDGLSDDEAALCQKLIRIPTAAGANTSFNIAMAAGLIFYHWHLINIGAAEVSARPDTGAFLPIERKERLHSTERGREDWADSRQKERFLDYLMETLGHTKFLKYPDNEAVKARIRRWLQVAQLPVGELLFGFEILYHLKSWGTGKFESRDFLDKPGIAKS